MRITRGGMIEAGAVEPAGSRCCSSSSGCCSVEHVEQVEHQLQLEAVPDRDLLLHAEVEHLRVVEAEAVALLELQRRVADGRGGRRPR